MMHFSKKLLLSGFVGAAVGIYADLPTGLIGGQNLDSSAYAAFPSVTSGSLPPLPGLPGSSTIYSVAINLSGAGLIGGNDASGVYAAQVSQSGVVSPLSITFTEGQIYAVAINSAGNGLIGGNDSLGLFAAQVSPEGIVTPIDTPFSTEAEFDAVFSAALNDEGVGLIGGEGLATLFAAYVAADRTLTIISTPDMEPGQVSSVALNDLGDGIIGGEYDGLAYAALVYNGNPSPSVLDLSGINYISGVAIDSSGLGLIGGASLPVATSLPDNAYAAFVSTEGDVNPIFLTPFAGGISSVAINQSGVGLIGGQNGSDLYAAFVQTNGNITSLISESLPGLINSVAINDAGVGLIGGQNGSIGYAALVAPNGTLTTFNLSDVSEINSVSLIGATNAATPTSTGPYLGVIYTQLAAAAAMETRFTQQNPLWKEAQGAEVASLESMNSEMYLVSRDDNPSFTTANRKKQTKMARNNSFWLSPFGDYVHLKAQGSIPNYTNTVGGALAGYDHHTNRYLIGASLGYAFNYVHYSESLGHGKIQEEMANLYGSYYADHFRLNVVFWGGFYQFYNTRHTLSMITSKGKTHGWIFSPHLEMASPWAIGQSKRYFVEPFFMLDWVNSWQNHYTETGDSGFNLKMDSFYGSLLQSEAGLRFYERFANVSWDFCLEEKVSYVNQAPFHFNSVTTSFVGATSGFPIAVASTKVENLAALEVMGTFVPRNKSYPYGGFDLQVTANGSYQSYFVSLFGGIDY